MARNLTVLVPFRNEARTLPELVTRLSKLSENIEFACVFVDDGSTDGSRQLLIDSLFQSKLKYELMSKPNGGKSSAIREGLKVISTSHVVILDADLELEPEEISKLWNVVIKGKSDYIFGYRQFLAQSAFTYRYTIGNRLISNLYGICFNQVITDIMCGFKLIPTDFLRSLEFRYKKFGIEIEIPIAMWKRNIRPFEVQVSYTPRGWSDGKTIGMRDAMMLISAILTCRIRTSRKRIFHNVA
jgi:dolichol-phosphate hexosyltransferase